MVVQKADVWLLCLLCSVELKQSRADRETVLSQTEREKDMLRDALTAAQQEAQRSVRMALADHHEELERLTSQKVKSFCTLIT